MNTQTVGQPLILQCTMTIINNVDSKVDFVWKSNGVELKRVEGVNGNTVSNSLVYTHHYIIPQLSDDDNNSLYSCEVVINTSSVSATSSNITLNVTGEFNVHNVNF